MNNQQFFSSSNSMLGFQSYFDKIYDPKQLKRIFIIKGGPGTGKSSTIRAVGEHFENTMKCEYFLCSSDPDSLDGLIINEEIALIDGTSPHCIDAKFPGAIEILIDNARGLSKNINKRKDDIIDLCEQKTKLYKIAYAYLRAAGELKQEQLKKISSGIDIVKLDAAIGRFYKQNISLVSKETNVRLNKSITAKGMIRTNSYESQSETTAVITNAHGFENAIFKRFLNYQGSQLVSYDPLLPWSPNALMFNYNSVSIVGYDKEIHGEIDYDKYKVFNCERFIEKSVQNQLRSSIKFTNKCNQALINEAIKNLSKASDVHKKLEEIYIEHNDFTAVDENTYKIIHEAEEML